MGDKSNDVLGSMLDQGICSFGKGSACVCHVIKDVVALVTHGILSGKAVEILKNSALSKLVITNTVPIPEEKIEALRVEDGQQGCRLEFIDIAPVLAEAIRRTHNGESVSYLFNHPVS